MSEHHHHGTGWNRSHSRMHHPASSAAEPPGNGPNAPTSTSPPEGLLNFSATSLDVFFESQLDGSASLFPSSHVGHEWFLRMAETYMDTFLTSMREGRFSECSEIATAVAYKLMEKGTIHERKMAVATLGGVQWRSISLFYDARDLVFRALLTLCSALSSSAHGMDVVGAMPQGANLGAQSAGAGSTPHPDARFPKHNRTIFDPPDESGKGLLGAASPSNGGAFGGAPPKMRFKRPRDTSHSLPPAPAAFPPVGIRGDDAAPSKHTNTHSAKKGARQIPTPHIAAQQNVVPSEAVSLLHGPANGGHKNWPAYPPYAPHPPGRTEAHLTPYSAYSEPHLTENPSGQQLVHVVNDNDVVCGLHREEGVLDVGHFGNILFHQRAASQWASFATAHTSDKGKAAMDAVDIVYGLSGRFIVKMPHDRSLVGTNAPFFELSLEESRWRVYWSLEKYQGGAVQGAWASQTDRLMAFHQSSDGQMPKSKAVPQHLATHAPASQPIAKVFATEIPGPVNSKVASQVKVGNRQTDGKSSIDHTQMFRHIPTHLTYASRVENMDRALFPVTVKAAAAQDEEGSMAPSGNEPEKEKQEVPVKRDSKWKKADRARRRREKFERAKALLSGRRSESPDPFADIAQMRVDAVNELRKRQERTEIRKRLATWDPS